MKIIKYIRKRPKLFTGIGIACFVVIATIVVLVVLLAGGDDCHKPPAVPAILSFLQQDTNLIVSWPKSGFFGHCKLSFLVHYSVNDGKIIEVSTIDYSYTIPDIPGCTNVVVEIWTVSATDIVSKDSLIQYHTVIPQEARVINLSTIATTEGVLVTWEKPQELEECEASYRIRYTSDLGDFYDRSTNESVIIPENIFCITIDIEVAAVIGHSQTRYASITFQETRILDIRTSVPNPFSPYLMAATWTYPNAELCSLQYTVTFSGDEGQDSDFMETLETRVLFFFVYCVLGEITITPTAFHGTLEGPPAKKIFTERPDPHIIYPAQFEEFTQTAEAIIMRWYDIPGIRNCDLTYRIEFRTELGDFAYMVDDITYNISRSKFCFSVDIEVIAISGGIYGQPTPKIARYDIEPVEDLTLNLSPNSTALIAKWTTNHWQEQCDLQYVVTYEHGIITRSSIQSQKTATFTRAYCATTIVRVSIAYGGAQSKEEFAEYASDDPIFLPPVENIRYIEGDSSMTVSWDLSESVSECTYLYVVTAKNTDLNQETICQGIKSCEILLSSFCPSTLITITSKSLPGDSVTDVYTCDSYNSL